MLSRHADQAMVEIGIFGCLKGPFRTLSLLNSQNESGALSKEACCVTGQSSNGFCLRDFFRSTQICLS